MIQLRLCRAQAHVSCPCHLRLTPHHQATHFLWRRLLTRALLPALDNSERFGDKGFSPVLISPLPHHLWEGSLTGALSLCVWLFMALNFSNLQED